MNLALTESQEFFRETTRRFLEERTPLTKVRELQANGGGFERSACMQATEIGWTSTLVDERHGGGSLSGRPLADAVIVAEEMGRMAAPGPYVPVNVVAGALPAHGTDQQRADVLPGLLSGQAIAADSVIGEPGQGWAVAHSLLFHERNATAGVAHGFGYSSSSETRSGFDADAVFGAARFAGADGDPHVRQLIAEAFVASTVARQVGERVMTGLGTGAFKGDWGSLLKLGMGIDSPRTAEIELVAAGTDGVIWTEGGEVDGAPSRTWLESRQICIAGGTNEMQRNIVSERLLGMPREPADDRDIPFSEVVARRRQAD